jgi:nucleotide-binding universal stress UspA family protein
VADVTRPRQPGTIVVGVDRDGPHDRVLLAAALDQARHTGSAVRVVHAIAPDTGAGAAPVDAVASRARVAAPHNHQNAILDDLRRHVDTDTAGAGPRIAVDCSVRHGDPATILLWAAQYADLIVIGTRGTSPGSPLLLGTVSQDVAVHATCPVLLIPAPEPARLPRP